MNAKFSLVDGFTRIKTGGALIKISHPHKRVTFDEYDAFLLDGEWPDDNELIRIIAGREDAIGLADNHGDYKEFIIYKEKRHA